ncbi:hypothetical protein [Metapseudomonas resinovorans]|uniref:hypothetical protein n=1 Tax=Metapseudomonas resinovorans TaxID=53412 RepID=UPI0003A3DE83|nr:hypothetical protein [Pseudomonas resinovorans]
MAKICSNVFDDLRIDGQDREHLPEMITLIRAMCAKGQTLVDAAERVLVGQE